MRFCLYFICFVFVCCEVSALATLPKEDACNNPKNSILIGAPPQFVAIFDYDCAKTFPEVSPEKRVDFAQNLGYPSLLFEVASEEEVINLVLSVVEQGDRGFFIADPKIIYELEKRTAQYDLEQAMDFIRSTQDPQKSINENKVSEEFLLSLPLWNRPENVTLLDQWCSNNDCAASESVCDSTVGLIDKVALAAGEKSFAEIYSQCQLSFNWILSLRQSGLIDTSCSSTFQVNTVMSEAERLGESCFDKDFSFSGSSVKTSVSIARFLREYVRAFDELPELGDEDIQFINEYFSGSAEFLAGNKQTREN